MSRERREHRKLTPEDVKKTLNRKQLASLYECQYFGWRVKFIRCPLFQDPVPVLFNSKLDQIGVMDPDGHINMDPELDLRSDGDITEWGEAPQQAEQAPADDPGHEKRGEMLPVPEDLDELLNSNQLRALQQIEKFGWKLQFVRRPASGHPVPVILSPQGDRYATLERDGRINMTPDLAVRQRPQDEQAASPTEPPAEIKQAD